MRYVFLVGIALFAMFASIAQEAAARSESRPRIGHHSGMNGPSKAGWGGKGGYHH
jgi:hypothetical protein